MTIKSFLSLIVLAFLASCCKPPPVAVTASQPLEIPECTGLGYAFKATSQPGGGTIQVTLFHPEGQAPMMAIEGDDGGAWALTDTGGMVKDAPPPAVVQRRGEGAADEVCLTFGPEDRASDPTNECIAALVKRGFCVGLEGAGQ